MSEVNKFYYRVFITTNIDFSSLNFGSVKTMAIKYAKGNSSRARLHCCLNYLKGSRLLKHRGRKPNTSLSCIEYLKIVDCSLSRSTHLNIFGEMCKLSLKTNEPHSNWKSESSKQNLLCIQADCWRICRQNQHKFKLVSNSHALAEKSCIAHFQSGRLGNLYFVASLTIGSHL